MPDFQPQYRFRGNVKPSAEVSRPVAAHRNATAPSDGTTTSSATLDIFDVIDSYGGWFGISARDVDAALKQIGDVGTLYVRLNSPGGQVTEGVAIANLLRAHPADVRVTVYGMAASAASYIAVSGSSLSMAPGSLMFVHDAINIVFGDAADLRKEADTLDTMSDSIAGLYVLKAGGTTEQWRAAMHADTWYSAEAAVAAKLADRVGIDPQMPTDLPAVEDDTDDTTVIEIDIEVSPAALAAARRFDLSMLPNAPAALAPKTPAKPPETLPTETKESAVDEIEKVLRERLGVNAEATLDVAGLTAALDQALAEHADPKVTDEAIATARGLKPEQVTAALNNAKEPVVPEGMTVISEAMLASLKSGAQAGIDARAKQHAEDRDKALDQAQFVDGKITAAERADWAKAYDRNPENAVKDLGELGRRFPSGPTAGYAGTAEANSADEDLYGSLFGEQKAGV